MTQKELLYMEDAVGHEDNLIQITEFTIETLEDKSLKNFMKGQLKKHQAIKQKLMNVLEGIANE
ncbi:MAG: hypothetical protein K2J20_04695 [Bacilli bacterium]|nr:hypothetical protein [Bacilli bacterium]